MRHLTRSERGSFGVQIKGPDEIKKGPPVLCSQAGCEMLMGDYGIGELTKEGYWLSLRTSAESVEQSGGNGPST
jgi:hypothetical protein